MSEGKKGKEIVRRTVALRAQDEALVLGFGKAHGLDFSSALRFIISEWAKQRALRSEALQARGEGEELGVRS